MPLEFHAHCNNGMAPFNLLEAVKHGVRHPAHGDTAAGQRLVAAVGFQRRGQRCARSAYKPLGRISKRCKPVRTSTSPDIAKREGLPVGAPREYDQALVLAIRCPAA